MGPFLRDYGSMSFNLDRGRDIGMEGFICQGVQEIRGRLAIALHVLP